MRHISVMVFHAPDAGRESRSHFSYQDALKCSDPHTARDFAFRALGDGSFQKGFVRVVFPETATYQFRFERAGIMGYHLTQAQQHPQGAI